MHPSLAALTLHKVPVLVDKRIQKVFTRSRLTKSLFKKFLEVSATVWTNDVRYIVGNCEMVGHLQAVLI
jgi:hypothetical protein